MININLLSKELNKSILLTFEFYICMGINNYCSHTLINHK